jgi:hypothetical protein
MRFFETPPAPGISCSQYSDQRTVGAALANAVLTDDVDLEHPGSIPPPLRFAYSGRIAKSRLAPQQMGMIVPHFVGRCEKNSRVARKDSVVISPMVTIASNQDSPTRPRNRDG